MQRIGPKRAFLAVLGVLGVGGLAVETAVWGAAPRVVEKRPTKEGIDFVEKKIRPVLVHNCYKCHSGDVSKAKGKLVLDSRDGIRNGGSSGAVVVPGHADTSPLIEAIKYEGLEMPPDAKLPDEVIDDFVRWVEMGAPDPRVGKAANPKNKVDLAEARRYWAFKRPQAPPPPKLSDTSWGFTDIDRLVRARQEPEKLRPIKDADKLTLLRRVTFDLTGLPPTPEESDAFVKDTSANAWAATVDRLLASPRFGERWGRHWLDVARYGESSGKDRNVPYRYAWRYRDYVIDSFNADKPYDRFILEQLAGDLLQSKSAAEHNELLVATGFLALGPKAVTTRDPEQFKVDVIDDQIDVTGRALLGMTIACARCHDHKFDPIPTTDYYALAGIFHSTETYSGVRANKKTAGDKQLLPLTGVEETAKPPPPPTAEQTAHREEIAKIESELDALHAMQRQAAKRAGPNKKLAQNMKRGRGKQVQYRPPVAASAPKIDQKDLRDKIKSLEDRLDELEKDPSPRAFLAMGVRDAQSPADFHVLNRGELKDKGPDVPRGVLTVLKTPQTAHINPAHSGRMELARWIADKNNPLTARVMVNRVWEHLFGQGIVDTVDNFGALGNEPSNPELLDLLAVQFMEQKWSVKRLIRSIVMSRVYRLSSDHNADNYAIDPSNRFLWRMDRRRLDAEEIRDALLAASGQLDLNRPDGSPVLELGNTPVGGGKGMQAVRKPSNVRSVYLPILRGIVPEMLGVFDLADPSLIVGKRDVTTVPTQALFLMNNPFVLKQSDEMARRVLERPGLDQAGRIDFAYRVALGRPPTKQEQSDVSKFLNDYMKTAATAPNANPQRVAWASLCQTLFESAEFRYLY